MGKRWRKVTSVATVFAFAAAIAWPQGARADQPPPPPPPAAAQPAPAEPAPAAQSADDQALATAKAHFEAGKAAYQSGDYRRAISEFKEAAKLRPSPILDYNIGLAHEKLGHPRVAVKYYQRYLAGMPNAPNRAEVEANIQTLQQQAQAQPQPQPQPGEQPETTPPPPQTYPTYGSYDPYAPQPGQYPVQAPKKKKSHWWVGLIIAGGVLVVVGIVVAVAVVEYEATNTVYDTSPALRALPPTGPSESAPKVGGITFRF